VNGQERLALAVSVNSGQKLLKDPELLKVMPPANVRLGIEIAKRDLYLR